MIIYNTIISYTIELESIELHFIISCKLIYTRILYLVSSSYGFTLQIVAQNIISTVSKNTRSNYLCYVISYYLAQYQILTVG